MVKESKGIKILSSIVGFMGLIWFSLGIFSYNYLNRIYTMATNSFYSLFYNIDIENPENYKILGTVMVWVYIAIALVCIITAILGFIVRKMKKPKKAVVFGTISAIIHIIVMVISIVASGFSSVIIILFIMFAVCLGYTLKVRKLISSLLI